MDFLDPVICGGRFGWYIALHHYFWINNKSFPDNGIIILEKKRLEKEGEDWYFRKRK